MLARDVRPGRRPGAGAAGRRGRRAGRAAAGAAHRSTGSPPSARRCPSRGRGRAATRCVSLLGAGRGRRSPSGRRSTRPGCRAGCCPSGSACAAARSATPSTASPSTGTWSRPRSTRRRSSRRVDRPDLLLVGALLHDIGKGWPGDHSEVGVAVVADRRRRGWASARATSRCWSPSCATTCCCPTPRPAATSTTRRRSRIVAAAVRHVRALDLLHALTEADGAGHRTGGLERVEGRPGGRPGGADPCRARRAHGAPPPSWPRRTPTSCSAGELAVSLAPAAVRPRGHRRRTRPGRPARHGRGRAQPQPARRALGARRRPAGPAAVQVWHGPARVRRRPPASAAARGRAPRPRRAPSTSATGWPCASESVPRPARASPSRRPGRRRRRRARTSATVLEVRAHDRPGLLHRIGAALAAAGVDVRSARVSTLGSEAVDVFYVVGPDGDPLPAAEARSRRRGRPGRPPLTAPRRRRRRSGRFRACLPSGAHPVDLHRRCPCAGPDRGTARGWPAVVAGYPDARVRHALRPARRDLQERCAARVGCPSPTSTRSVARSGSRCSRPTSRCRSSASSSPRVKERAIGAEVSQALNPAQQVIKIVDDELVRVLGGETRRVRFAKTPPTVIMLVGLQGAGKTTLAGKLAKWFREQGAHAAARRRRPPASQRGHPAAGRRRAGGGAGLRPRARQRRRRPGARRPAPRSSTPRAEAPRRRHRRHRGPAGDRRGADDSRRPTSATRSAPTRSSSSSTR